jgi:Spy/CpxP family protein refolding chaperone
MSRFTKSLLLAGVLGATSSGTTLVVARADGPTATAPATGQPKEGGKPWGKHRGMGRMGMSERLTAHAQELGLTTQQLSAIKAAEDAAKPELEKLHQQLRARHEALRTQIDGILTADQKAKLQAMREQHGRRGFRGPRGE